MHTYRTVRGRRVTENLEGANVLELSEMLAGRVGRVSQLGGAVELRRSAGPGGSNASSPASSTVSSSLSSEPSFAVLATILKRLHDECRSLDSFDECAPVALAQGCC